MKEDYLDLTVKLATNLGIVCEPSGIASLGLLLQLKDKLPKNKKILVVNTGKIKYS